MLSTLFDLLHGLLDIYKLLVIVYVAVKLLGISANKWTTLLAQAVEPLLIPIRKLIAQYLPKKWQIFDWSPLVLILLVCIVQWLL